jgi:DNA-sulfur modification-associated
LKKRGATKMLKDRKELETSLVEVIEKIKHNKTKVNKIKRGLKPYNIDPGMVMKILNHAEDELAGLDLRLLCLLTEQVYLASSDMSIKIDDYFTETEIKTSRVYDALLEKDEKMELPLTLNNVLMIDDENYITTLDIKFIKKMFDSELLRYNFDTQREARFVKRHGTIERVAKVDQKSVKEITERLLTGRLSPTTITFNCLAGTADEGNEIVYDAKKQQLTITKGTFIDILDGFHRLKGAMNALEINPDLSFKFQVAIKNYNISTAQKHLAEISKVNVIDKAHIEALEQSRYSDVVVKQLQRDSELKGRVSQTTRVHTLNNEIVSYNVLADTIDEMFEMNTKRDAMEVAAYLTEFFDYLLGTYHEAFIDNVEKIKEKSLINTNNMFAGYVVLAKRMKDEGVPITKLPNVLDKIDFSRENPEWEKLGILENGTISRKARKQIVEYFKNLDLKEGVKS